MNKLLTGLVLAAIVLTGCKPADVEVADGLKDRFGDKFLVGCAMNQRQINGEDSLALELVKKNFNSVVAENCMKCEIIHPERDRFYFEAGDSLADFAEQNDMALIGHCLIWHSQCAPWFFVHEDGTQVSADTLRARMRDHITTIVSHYKGRVHGWDVVNEAILEDGSYRQSKFYEILGEEFIPYAFELAHEADPDVELYINDYAMNMPGKREAYVKLVNDMKARGIRIDAIGMQSHMGIDYPRWDEFEASIEAFASTGCNVMMTEWDMSVLPTIHTGANIGDKVEFDKAMNPYGEELPDSISQLWNERMATAWDIFLRHADVITRVTAWGVTDGDSWKNDYPMKGRKEYPLLFDRNYELKPFLNDN